MAPPFYTMKLTPPTTYQGIKIRIADEIAARILEDDPPYVVDICCGSGAVALALINAGYPSEKVIFNDIGCMGLFYKTVTKGCFDLDKFAGYLADIPTDIKHIQAHIKKLAKRPITRETILYVYLVLQAAAFGGKQVHLKQGQHPGFREYWQHPGFMNHHAPMCPMPIELYARVNSIFDRLALKSTAHHMNVYDCPIPQNAIVYIDPPYKDTLRYGHNFNIYILLTQLKHHKCYVSESYVLSGADTSFSLGKVTASRISALRDKAPHTEWISIFNPKW